MWLKLTVIWLIILFSVDFIEISEGLKASDDGVCVVKISTRKTRTKLVTINKWCGKKKCVVKKVEHYTVPEERTVCCKGWVYDVQSDSCAAICSTGCTGGRCIAPDECFCDPPATLDPEHKNTCIRPICDPPCINAKCSVNNTCSCLPDYSVHNSTHCFKCDPGYSLNGDFTCEPICDNPCVNSDCTSPNKCTCLDGYKSVNSSVCEPSCEACVNSTCTAPNTCSCLEGYKKLNDTVCVPKCESCDGDCIGPNVCNCRAGFKNIDGVCKPICEACEHGVCSAPGVCTCNEGYVRNGSDPTKCVKSCNRPTEVEVSVPKTQYKRLPIRVKCPKGTKECTKKEREYFPHFNMKTERCCLKKYTERQKRISCCPGWEFIKDEDICKAQCRFGCENGRCVAPDVCECDPPLYLIGNKCVSPVCDPPCVHGKCIANDTCECETGFKTHNSTHCAPECETGYKNDPETLVCIPECVTPCLNGNCTGPNTCTCLEGYKPQNEYNCIPDCSPSCINADCVGPNTCSCWEGYRFNTSNTCNPVCDACENGECVAPNTCDCHEGYMKKDGACVPVCDPSCNNGVCSAPNVCQCNAGYENDNKNKFDCLPICEARCVNASCVSPNTCVCYSGYEIAESDYICKPICNECDHGECVAPNVCRCLEGYSERNGKCAPDCEKTCKNGFCSKPNTCTCNEGYEIDKEDKFTCTPICDQNCVNATCTAPNRCSCIDGYERTDIAHICKPNCISCNHGECVAPNVCQCHEGYNLADGKCVPVCYEDCQNGYCSSPNMCSCDEGYKKNSTRSSICFKPCENSCEHGVCSLDGICRCDKGYQMINRTCSQIPSVECSSCKYNCSSGDCWCDDGIPCVDEPAVEAEMSDSTGLAGLQLTWTLAAAIGVLMLTLVMYMMHRIYRQRKECGSEDPKEGNRYGSVVYTVPDTLIQRNDFNDGQDDQDADDDTKKTDRLLTSENIIQDEKL